MKRRLLSIILVLILCLTLTPVSVLAEGESVSQEPDENPGPFTVTFDLNGDQSLCPGIDLSKISTPDSIKDVEKGSKISKPESPQEGQADASGLYYLSHWACNGSKWNFDTDTVEKDITLYAVWKSKYTEVHEKVSTSGMPYDGTVEYRDADGNVKYTLQKGDINGKYREYSHQKVESGSYYLYVGGTRIGSAFNPGPGGYPFSHETELFHVSYDSNGQEFTDATKPEDILCYTTGLTANNKISKPATTPQAKNSSYVFAGWTTGPDADSEGYDFSKKITADTTIYAQWIKADDADSVIVTAENSSIKGSRTVKKGQDYTATLVPNSGYELPYHEAMSSYRSYTYVEVDGQLLDAGQYSLDCNTGKITIPGVRVTGNILIHTVPKKNPYLVTFTNNGGSGTQEPIRVYGSGEGYDYEKDGGMNYHVCMPECTITPPDGKVFAQWDNDKKPGEWDLIFGNKEFYPVWADAPDGVYTVSYDLTNCSFSGSVNTTKDADYTTKLVAETDYRQPFTLAEVSVGDQKLTSSDYTFDEETGELTIPAEKITGNIKIKASAARGYHVTLQQEGGGSVTASSELALEGETVTLTATAGTGYTFKGWQVVSPEYLTIGTENSFTMPAEDVTVKAIFEPQMYSGKCGENLTWTLNAGTGVLSIDGTGDMTSAPWLDNYKDLIKTVKISEGVTSLWYDGNRWTGAFAYCGNLTSVELPSSMTTLGNFSFRQCYNLKSITIPEGMTTLGNYAFMHCTGLQSITLPDTLRQIDGSVFYNCTALGDVYFNGTQQQWDAIHKDGLDGANKTFRDAALHILRHTVTYDAKGGQNAPEPQIKNVDEPLILSSKIPVREGYTFFGWSTDADADIADYQPGDKFERDKDTTLYAVWKEGIYQIEASPQTLTFDSRLEGYTSLPETQTVTITNTGDRKVDLQQPTAQTYELGQLSQTMLEPGQTATFTVQPKSGLETGTYEEPITITTTDGIHSTVTVKFTVEKPPVTPEPPGEDPGEKPGKPGTPGTSEPSVTPGTPGQTPAGNQGEASLTGSSALQNPDQASAQTGDESNRILWFAVLLLGAAGAAGSMLGRKKIQ